MQKRAHLGLDFHVLEPFEEREENPLHFRGDGRGYRFGDDLRGKLPGGLYGVPIWLDEKIEKDGFVIGIRFLQE